jgi:glycosyltransferase involved in cell wall biosynthesis
LLYYAPPSLASISPSRSSPVLERSAGVRVAMDGSFLALPSSGTGTYLRALTAALREIEPSLDLHLLIPSWADASRPGQGPFDRLRNDRRLRRATWELFGVASAAREARPDLLHVPHFSAPVRPRCPLVVTIHDVVPLVVPAYRATRAMRLHLAVVKRTVRAARLILTPSHAAATDVSRVLGIPPERIRVTPEAAGPAYRPADDPQRVRETTRRLGVTGRYVFNVGGLDVRKNLPVLLEAFAHLRTRLDEPLQLVIAGAAHTDNPSVYPSLTPIVHRLGLDEAVVLPGRITDDDKIALYQGAALYATPSLYEGFGLTTLEAMACGVPTLASNRTSLPEVVGDGGFLVEPDAEAFATAMLDVLTNPTLASALRFRGLARAALFTWQETARLTLAAYQESVDAT